ncbi:sugar nucleotide-binding protein [Brevibacillus daliensis]|uniref:sugar nucleotide-binding protein n=1 Tax=Brevibacillus daliensis TaxID=2892995 RepID=UPI001E2D6011|nr:sugar nucleotide-binding protein [Brevibacillus daliensis]
MNVLVLGASGYVGSMLYSKLITKMEFRVTGTCYREERPGLLKVDVRNEESIRACLLQSNPEVLIWALMSGEEEEKLIMEGLRHTCTHLQKDAKLIFLSTDGVFSEGKGGYSEQDTPSFFLSESNLSRYSNAKLNGERFLQESWPNHVIIRIGPVYGQKVDGSWDKRISSFLMHQQQHKVLPAATNMYRSFVHVDDVTDAIVELLPLSYQGIIHLTPDQKESPYTFYSKMAVLLGERSNNLVIKDLEETEASKNGVPFDTSLRSIVASTLLSKKCRNVGEVPITLHK